MIMYIVSKYDGVAKISWCKVISHNKITVHIGWSWGGAKHVERMIKKESIWFESKSEAINKAREWALELLDKAVSELKESKALDYIELIALGEEKWILNI